MQIAEFPLNALISIHFNAVDERGPGSLYSIFDVNMLQVDLPEALGPEQVVDVLVSEWWTWCPLGRVGGSGTYPSSNF